MSEIKFQYYPARVNTTKPVGYITINEFFEGIKNPSDKLKDIFKRINKAEVEKDFDLKSKLKQENLFYFTPCVWLNWNGVDTVNNKGVKYKSYRCYKNLDSFTGLIVLDFDHIENAPQFKKFIFDNYKFVVCAFLSASKKGVKFLIKIPIVNSVDEFKSYFYGLGFYFDKFKGWDGCGQNAVLPLFTSYDPNILYRDNAETFNFRGKKLRSFKLANQGEFVKVEPKDGDQKRIYDNARKAFNNIISNGHPQVIAACVSLGGYVSSGYITQQDAESFAYSMIEQNNYLKKGISGYKKTATTAIQTGMKSQLIIE